MNRTEVLLDATALGEAAGQRGVGSYVRGLLGALGAREDLAVRALHRSTALPPGVTGIAVERHSPGRWRQHERDLRLSAEFRRHAHGAVVHSLDTEPPWHPPRPFVQTLFDVIPLVVDDPALGAQRARWQRLAVRFRKADRVIAISRHAADTGIAELELDPRRVIVAPLGVDDHFAQAGPVHREADDVPYVLLVGEYARRKGFEEAFAVIGRLAELGLPHRLIVAGRLAPWTSDRVRALVAGSAAPDRIRLAGFVEDLAALYRGAAATIVTSRYEGFGLPAVESMSAGTPVVSFANTALEEVVGAGGVLVADGDVAAFAAAVHELLTTPGRREEVSDAGRVWVARFRWDTCAQLHADVYHDLGARA